MVDPWLISFAGVIADQIIMHGATIMLALLASRWLCSIIGMVASASAANRSLRFNAIAFAAYLAGAANYLAVGAEGAFGPLSGVFFALNIALIGLDSVFILFFRWMGDRFERRIRRLAMR